MQSELERQLILDEGLKTKAYKCPAGLTTIGVGRNIETFGLSVEECIYLLRNDIDRCIQELSGYEWFDRLHGVRRDAVINMYFNIGGTRFAGFKKMISALERQDFAEAAKQMLDSRWSRQVGARAQRLATEMMSGNKIK